MQSENFILYQDGEQAFNVPENVRLEIASYGKETEDEYGKIAFCGFVFENKNVHLFLPKGSSFDIKSGDERKKARLLFRTLEKYYRTEQTFLMRDGKTSLTGSPQILPLINFFVDDYRHNGIYINSSHVERRGSTGKIDWNKTIKSVQSIYDKGKLVFPEFVNRIPNHNTVSEITKIHNWVLNDIDSNFGWLYSDNNFIFPELHATQEKRNLQNDLYLINRELTKTYSDQKIFLLRNLIKYLESKISTSSSNSFTFGFNDFHWVWEKMLATTMEPITEFKLPYPAYRDQQGNINYLSRKGQKVDIFLYDSVRQAAHIIDAKYYFASSTNSAPGWPDLVKQFFYAKSLMASAHKNNIKSVWNYFVFPGVATKQSPKEGFVVNENKERLDEEFPPIQCLFIEPEIVMEAFVKGGSIKELRDSIFNFAG